MAAGQSARGMTTTTRRECLLLTSQNGPEDFEGNRMRFSTTPALLVVELCLVGELLARHSRS
jgi:hypothetical protein